MPKKPPPLLAKTSKKIYNTPHGKVAIIFQEKETKKTSEIAGNEMSSNLSEIVLEIMITKFIDKPPEVVVKTPKKIPATRKKKSNN